MQNKTELRLNGNVASINGLVVSEFTLSGAVEPQPGYLQASDREHAMHSGTENYHRNTEGTHMV